MTHAEVIEKRCCTSDLRDGHDVRGRDDAPGPPIREQTARRIPGVTDVFCAAYCSLWDIFETNTNTDKRKLSTRDRFWRQTEKELLDQDDVKISLEVHFQHFHSFSQFYDFCRRTHVRILYTAESAPNCCVQEGTLVSRTP